MDSLALLERCKSVTIDDRSSIMAYLRKFPQRICELTFGNFFLWGESRDHRWTEVEGHLVVSFQKRGKERMWYPPIGPDPAKLINDVLKPSLGYRWFYVGEEIAHNLQGNAMAIEETPDRFDYVYDLGALRSLAGGKYTEKRNFIKRCRALNPDIVSLNASHSDECQAMLSQWMERDHEGMDSASDEISALRLAMKNFDAMEFTGTGIRINGEMQAFAIGTAMTETMFLEHFEKSTNAYPGLYPLIFHEFAKSIPQQYTELNKEEDLGLEGLRTAKMRWHPQCLVKKYQIS